MLFRSLPEPIRQAVATHHRPHEADKGRLHLAHVLESADRHVNELGIGMAPYIHKSEPVSDTCLKGFGLREHIEKINESFQTEFKAISSFL